MSFAAVQSNVLLFLAFRVNFLLLPSVVLCFLFSICSDFLRLNLTRILCSKLHTKLCSVFYMSVVTDAKWTRVVHLFFLEKEMLSLSGAALNVFESCISLTLVT